MTAELIKTTGITLNGENITAVNARDLWKFLESKQEFANWIKDRIEKYRFVEGKDFLINFSKSLGRPSKEYIISLDMAKELAMVENNERGRQARQYFIEVEKRYRHTGSLEENHPRRSYADYPRKWTVPRTSGTGPELSAQRQSRRSQPRRIAEKQIPPQLLRRTERARHLASANTSPSAPDAAAAGITFPRFRLRF